MPNIKPRWEESHRPSKKATEAAVKAFLYNAPPPAAAKAKPPAQKAKVKAKKRGQKPWRYTDPRMTEAQKADGWTYPSGPRTLSMNAAIELIGDDGEAHGRYADELIISPEQLERWRTSRERYDRLACWWIPRTLIGVPVRIVDRADFELRHAAPNFDQVDWRTL